jgi:hypothetical protein
MTYALQLNFLAGLHASSLDMTATTGRTSQQAKLYQIHATMCGGFLSIRLLRNQRGKTDLLTPGIFSSE